MNCRNCGNQIDPMAAVCFLSFVSAIWGLVEGIMILTGSIAVDGKGVPLKD